MVTSRPPAAASLSVLRHQLADGVPPGVGNEDSVRRQWWAALATLQDDLLLPQPHLQGIWLAAPLPALYEPNLLQHLQGWVWAPSELDDLLPAASSLLPGSRPTSASPMPSAGFRRLALHSDDGTDPLLLVITPTVQVALCLDGPPQARRLVVRFDPQVLTAALTLINGRLQATDPEAGEALRKALQQLGSLHSDEHLVLRFWPRMAERLAAIAPSLTLQPLV
ncbi:MAG: sensor histidine kinase, partial [Synechococcaceae bacterium WB9_2_170]|nr:sensor histidine kinase [Synechococcaceae bacterium WB9_2_170]